MPYPWRLLRPVWLVTILLALTFPVASGYAQDQSTPQPVMIQGSLQLQDVMQAILDAYQQGHPDAQVQIDAQGPDQGFQALCDGKTDLVMSTTPISDEQVKACNEAQANFVETVIGYEAVVLLAPPGVDISCLSTDQVNEYWQFGAADYIWHQSAEVVSMFNPNPDSSVPMPFPTSEVIGAVLFYGPDPASPAYKLFASLVPAGALRTGITPLSPADLVAKVQEDNSTALAFMSFADLKQADPGSAVTPVQISGPDQECTLPNLSKIESHSYPLARTFYLYVNAESAQRPEVKALMEFVLADPSGAQGVIPAKGYTAASQDTYTTGLSNLNQSALGRTFSRAASPVKVAATEEGTVTIVGSSTLIRLTRTLSTTFESRFFNAKIKYSTFGNDAGWQAFCSGEADVLQTTRDATPEEAALCEQNEINPYTIDLGYDALILAVPSSNDWLTCLNADEVSKLLSAGTSDTPAPTKWNEVNPNWPDETLLLVAPSFASGETDYLVYTLLGDLTFLVRSDMVENDDSLYRVQGVANTAQDQVNPNNGLTYLWWSNLQGSTADVKLLSVDAGSGCQAPSLDTFKDGSYKLSYPVRYVFSQKAFSSPLVRAYLWHFFEKGTLTVLGNHLFAGEDLVSLETTRRNEVFDLLAAYEEMLAASQATPAATETATPEATETATPEATEMATPEATEMATAEATETPSPKATETATAEATPEVTEAATATPQP